MKIIRNTGRTIEIAESAGFCFGVKRALEIAFSTAVKNENVHMLGDIVHNQHVIEDIRKAGIRKVSSLSSCPGCTLLIRAHGTALATEKSARELGYVVVDATCPMVKEIHRIARKREQQGYKIIIIGEKEHDEVKGIMGQLSEKPFVISSPDDIPFNGMDKIEKACVVVQSTQNYDTVNKMEKELRKHINNMKFENTICMPTRTKQREARALPLRNDVMIVIGSRNSANTKRLFQIAEELNPRTHWIDSAKEIDPAWFSNARSIGVTAGASTPERIINNVVECLRKL